MTKKVCNIFIRKYLFLLFKILSGSFFVYELHIFKVSPLNALLLFTSSVFLVFFSPSCLLSAPSSQVSTGARCSATRRGWGFLCWKPNEETRRRLRPSAPWPLSLWPTLMPWSKGKESKITSKHSVKSNSLDLRVVIHFI